MSDENGTGPLRADPVGRAHARLRVDLVRRALRTGRVDPDLVRSELDAWIRIFHRDHQASLRVLLLELLAPIDDGRVRALAEESREDREDSVRYEAVRLLMTHQPERTRELAEAHLEDPGVELRLLAAERLYPSEPGAARDSLLRLVEEEARGRRETHVLDRVTEFFVETVGDTSVLGDLRSAQDRCEDPEGFLGWAIERLEERWR